MSSPAPAAPPGALAPPAPGDFEAVACPLCGAPDAPTFRRGSDRAHPLPGVFRLARCAVCGLVYQSPRLRPAALGRYYPADYWPFATRPGPSLVQRLGWPYGYELYRRLRFVERFQAPGELLDVGCATGRFLAGLERRGPWRGWGLEPDLAAARVARGHGLDVVVARFDEVSLAPRSLDAASLWDVLEHLPDPVGALRRLALALRPEGTLFLNVPDLGSLDARLFGGAWCGLDLPRHLTLFNRSTLGRALAAAGLSPLAFAYPTGGHYSFTRSLQQALASAGSGRAGPRWAAGPANALVRLAISPYLVATEAAGLGPSLTVAARPA